MLLNATELQYAMAMVCNNIEKKRDYKPALLGVHMVYDGNVLLIEGTNSYQMARIELTPIDNMGDADFNVIIEPLDLKSFVKKETNIILDMNTRMVRRLDGSEMRINLIEEVYPELERVIPKIEDSNFTIGFNVARLRNILKGMNTDSTVIMNFNTERPFAPVIMTDSEGKSLCSGQTLLLCPVRTDYI